MPAPLNPGPLDPAPPSPAPLSPAPLSPAPLSPAPPAPAIATSAVAAPAASAASPDLSASLVQQLDPPLVRIAAANGGTVSVRLHPAELGVVELHLDHGAAGQVRLTVRADRPDTLRLLGTERHRLDAALDRAGIKPGMIAFEPTRAAPAAPRHDGPAPLPAAHTHLPDASPHRSDPVTPIRDDRTATSGGWSNESRQQGDHSATRHSGDPDRSGRNRETASATRTAPRHGPAAPTSTAAGRQAGIDVTA